MGTWIPHRRPRIRETNTDHALRGRAQTIGRCREKVIVAGNDANTDAKLFRFCDSTFHCLHATEYPYALVTVKDNNACLVPKDGALRVWIYKAFGQTIKVDRDVAQTVSRYSPHFL